MLLRSILLWIVFLCIVSCSSENNEDNFYATDMVSSDSNVNTYDEFLAISEVVVPQDIKVNKVSKIKLLYTIPSSCHRFKDIYYEKKDSLRTYAVVSEVLKREDCKDSLQLESIDIDFKADQLGTYYLQFWSGKNEMGDIKYITYTVEIKD